MLKKVKVLAVLVILTGCILGVVSMISQAQEAASLGSMFIIIGIPMMLIYGTLEVIEILLQKN